MKPLVTALVDTFNQEKYIEQALVSVLEQGLSPSELEIVVVDDGSTDSTSLIVQKFLPRVKYLRKTNGGQASAFNAAFPEIHGEIVAPLDGDDWWARGKLSAVLETLEQHPEISGASHSYSKVYEETGETEICGPSETMFLSLTTPEAARWALRNWRYVHMGALTVRRKVMEEVIPIPEELVFSADSPIALASMAMGVLVLAQPLSYYRIHSSNLHAVGRSSSEKLRRKYEMDEVMFKVLRPMLLRMGVPSECVSAFLDPVSIEISRLSLSEFGGSRLKTFRTEVRAFRSEITNPSIGYRLFKYGVMGAAALLLSPRSFYRGRSWYARMNLGRFRERVFGSDAGADRGSARRST